MRKLLATAVLFVAVLAFASTAMAVAAPVFSSNITDEYGGAIEFDGTNSTVKVEFRLKAGVTYEGLPKFSDSYTAAPAWSSDWTTTSAEKFDMILMTLVPLPVKFKEIPVTCVSIEAGTTDLGEKIRCTQKTATAIGTLTQNQVIAWAGYMYVFLADAYTDPAVHQMFSFPLSLASLISKGITVEATETIADDDLDAIANDVDVCPSTAEGAAVDASGDYMGCSDEQKLCYKDGTLDCDADGVLNASDTCPEEAGTAENLGCAAAASSAETSATVGDGGGCSAIAPVATPNVSGILMLVLAALPMIARRKR